MGDKQYIVVSIGEEQFGINILDVENIVRMQKITRVPNLPNYVKGVINLRGEILPVLSLRLRMDLEEGAYTEDSRVIILNLEEYGLLGLVVDGVKEVAGFETEEVDKKFVKNIGTYEEELVFVLDLDAVLAAA